MRLVDADAVKKALRNRISENIDECINNVPTVDAIPTQAVKDAIAEIERKTNSGQWSEATVYGMQKAVAIIRKHTKVGDTV